jgi:hypothetical protein
MWNVMRDKDRKRYARKNMAVNGQRYRQLAVVNINQGRNMTVHREQFYMQMEETI